MKEHIIWPMVLQQSTAEHSITNLKVLKYESIGEQHKSMIQVDFKFHYRLEQGPPAIYTEYEIATSIDVSQHFL